MKEVSLKITENTPGAPGIRELVLFGDISGIMSPGEFVNISVPGHFLRRPISVSYRQDDAIGLYIKETGEGTRKLSALPKGSEIEVLTGLGRGFNLRKSGARPLVIGGGIGMAPMRWLMEELLAKGCLVTALFGLNTAADLLYPDVLEAFGNTYPGRFRVFFSTVDRSLGTGGFVTDIPALFGDYTFFYACGPGAMLDALKGKLSGSSGEMSLEARFGCGFGACMGCSIETRKGPKRVCRDGPVFSLGELL